VGSRPQLVVVSDLLVGYPHKVGYRLSWSIRLSRSLFTELLFLLFNLGYHRALLRTFLSHNWIFAITEPFTNFSFTRWNLGYYEAFSLTLLSYDGTQAITEPFHEYFFHMMELRLSQSLFMNFSLIRWNSGYYGAFSRTFLSYDGTQAITEPFTNISFSEWNLG
jgi:hypothetical protein